MNQPAGKSLEGSRVGSPTSLHRQRTDMPFRFGSPFRLAEAIRRLFSWDTSGRMLALSAITGAVVGMAGVVFVWGLESVQHWAMHETMGYRPPPEASAERQAPFQLPEHWWWVLLIPTLGGLSCGVVVEALAPEARGHGTDAVIRAFHGLRGVIPANIPWVKGLASVITIGTGGSAGREGPAMQIGAGIGSLLATRWKLSDWERRVLLLAGAGAGLGAVFRAPLGGAMFAVEVLYSTTAMEFAALGPVCVAAVVGYTVFVSVFGGQPMFELPNVPDPETSFMPCAFNGAHELPFYFVFGLLCLATAWFYVRVFEGVSANVFARLRLPILFKPAIGGLGVGLIALAYPQIMAGGYGWVQKAIVQSPDLPWKTMAILVLCKILATSFTISSGGSGGMFAPSLFIGAMLGGSFGGVCHLWFPQIAPPVSAFVLVGMGGFLAGVFKTPLAALIMVAELTGSHDLLVPMMLVSFLHVALLPGRISLCREQVPSLADSPAHVGDFVMDVLEQMRVQDVYHPQPRPTTIPETCKLPHLLRLAADSSQYVFPVVDRDNRLTGIISLNDLRSVLAGEGAGDLVIAVDIAGPAVTLRLGDDLHSALRLMARHRLEELPVVADDDPNQILGTLRRETILAAYDRRVAALRAGDESHRSD